MEENTKQKQGKNEVRGKMEITWNVGSANKSSRREASVVGNKKGECKLIST